MNVIKPANYKSALLLVSALLLMVCLLQTTVETEAGSMETAVAASYTPLSSPPATFTATDMPPSLPPLATEVSVMPEQPASQRPSEPTPQPAVQSWVDDAKADLSRRRGLPVEQIDLLSFELKEWSDSSLGCPRPGMAYAQVPQDGYLIRLGAEGQVYHYHGGGTGAPFLCER